MCEGRIRRQIPGLKPRQQLQMVRIEKERVTCIEHTFGLLHGRHASAEVLQLTVSHGRRGDPDSILLHSLAQCGHFVLGQSLPRQPLATRKSIWWRSGQGHQCI